jgi:hypothetical protein
MEHQISLCVQKEHIRPIKVKASVPVVLSVTFVRNVGYQFLEYVRLATFAMLLAFNMQLSYALQDTFA